MAMAQSMLAGEWRALVADHNALANVQVRVLALAHKPISLRARARQPTHRAVALQGVRHHWGWRVASRCVTGRTRHTAGAGSTGLAATLEALLKSNGIRDPAVLEALNNAPFNISTVKQFANSFDNKSEIKSIFATAANITAGDVIANLKHFLLYNISEKFILHAYCMQH